MTAMQKPAEPAPRTALSIRTARQEDFPAFFAYLNDHLADNGIGPTALFMPMPRKASSYPPERQGSFRNGVVTAVTEAGWRRLWLAWSPDGRIAGHIDLRARGEAAAAHRALLGMGVQRDFRRMGLGMQLIEHAVAWARNDTALDWIDLEVLSINAPARGLYRAAGFVQTGEIEDLFRIDGESLGYTLMSRRVR
jgi:YD repeat-containing protein